MDPKKLAQLLADKEAKEQAQKNAEKTAAIGAAADRATRQRAVEDALQNSVLPYLEDVKQTIGQKFTYGVSHDANTMKPAGVVFSIAGSKVKIESRFGDVSTTIEQKLSARPTLTLHQDISTASDLTPDKIGALIESLITSG
ncbi:hypothetical protein [Bradyrhizobium guangdongense]